MPPPKIPIGLAQIGPYFKSEKTYPFLRGLGLATLQELAEHTAADYRQHSADEGILEDIRQVLRLHDLKLIGD